MAPIRFLLTFFLGALPATYLLVLPLGLVGVSIASFRTGDYSGAVLSAAYALAATYGTLSLWIVPNVGPTKFVTVGLLLGVLTIAPLTYMAIGGGMLKGPDFLLWFSLISPPIVASWWIVTFIRQCFSKHGLQNGSDSSSG